MAKKVTSIVDRIIVELSQLIGDESYAEVKKRALLEHQQTVRDLTAKMIDIIRESDKRIRQYERLSLRRQSTPHAIAPTTPWN